MEKSKLNKATKPTYAKKLKSVLKLEVGTFIKKLNNPTSELALRDDSYYLPRDFEAARLVHKSAHILYFDVYKNGNLLRNKSIYVGPNTTAILASKAAQSNLEKVLLRRLHAPNTAISQLAGAVTGGDPEIFVLDENGVVIPAFSFLPDKTKVGPVSEINKASAFWDGFQAEFTVHPQGCLAYFVDNLREGLSKVLEAARKIKPGAKLTYAPVVDIPFNMMESASDLHAALGCAPSHNVYGEVRAIDVPNPRALPIRFAGCHMHFSHTSFKKNTIPSYVKSLDRIFGILSVSMLEGLEDARRREFYGRAGEYRTPAHGLEYRTPSTAVLCHPIVVHISFDMARAALEQALSKTYLAWEVPSEKAVQEIINNLDVKEARKILAANEGMLKNLINGYYSYYGTDKINKVMEIIHTGVKNVLDISSMEKSWRLGGEWAAHSNSPDAAVQHMSK